MNILNTTDLATAVPPTKDVLLLPTDFGNTITLIFKTHKETIACASDKLNVSAQTLSQIVNGRITPTKNFLARKNLRNKIQENYPLGWALYGKDYDLHAELLLPKQTQGLNEPADKNCFGYTLWLLCGGKGGHSQEVSKLLDITSGMLSRYIHGKAIPNPQTVLDKKWRDIFAARNPKLWHRLQPDFETRLQNKVLAQPSLRLMAAAFLSDTMKSCGKSINDLSANALPLVLRAPQIWKRALKGDDTLGNSLFRSAVIEICRQCDVPNRSNSLDRKATKLIAEFSKR